MFTTRKVTAEILSIVGVIRHEFTSAPLESSVGGHTLSSAKGIGLWPISLPNPASGPKTPCPVDCIHPKKNTTYDDGRPTFDNVPQLYIDPVECIDCGACVPVRPVSAIFALDDLPEKWKRYTELNERYVKAGKFAWRTATRSPNNYHVRGYRDRNCCRIRSCFMSRKTCEKRGKLLIVNNVPMTEEQYERLGSA
jgi:NAD-dependent dihydropyrimidine dehydrogenase PreA subunit